MRPRFLEAHLRREPATLSKYQLLWQFYVKDGQPLRAAEVLAILAESQKCVLQVIRGLFLIFVYSSIDLSLESRLEYLILAVGNAKSHPVTTGGRHETAIAFLTDLEEKLDVAKVQLEIYNALLPHISDPGEDGNKIQDLGKHLMTMSQVRVYASLFLSSDFGTQLYQLYAEPFDLPVMKLLILHVSGHRDDQLVRSIWDRVFEDGKHEAI